MTDMNFDSLPEQVNEKIQTFVGAAAEEAKEFSPRSEYVDTSAWKSEKAGDSEWTAEEWAAYLAEKESEHGVHPLDIGRACEYDSEGNQIVDENGEPQWSEPRRR